MKNWQAVLICIWIGISLGSVFAVIQVLLNRGEWLLGTIAFVGMVSFAGSMVFILCKILKDEGG